MNGHVALLYRSIARHPDFDHSDLDILRSALRFNGPHGITGYLWRANGQFFQALHGPEPAIAGLMTRIAVDPRHEALEVLMNIPADARSPFSDWSMGYDHFLEVSLGLDRDDDGARPPVDAARAAEIFEVMVRAAEEVRSFGSAFPFARLPGEPEADYLRRLDGAG